MADVLSHPEILPREKLIEMLSSRGIPEKDVCEKDKAALVQLFYRYIVPLPQRAANMRRANRLRKQLNPPVKSNNVEIQSKARVLKRKHEPMPGIHVNESSNVSNFLSQTKLDSPTTVCTKEIDKLIVDCVAKTPSKPIKLNRTFLKSEQKNKTNSEYQQQINNADLNDDTPRTEKAKKTTQQELSSCDSHIDMEEKNHKKAKKFKRTVVTWP